MKIQSALWSWESAGASTDLWAHGPGSARHAALPSCTVTTSTRPAFGPAAGPALSVLRS
jgi:hypothetical protein